MKSKILNEVKMVLSTNSENERFARGAVGSFVAMLDPTLNELADIRTVVSEAVTNSIIHGYAGKPGSISVTVRLTEGRTVYIKIADKGKGIEDIERAMQPLFTTDPSGERGGMGFAIMQSFTDSLSVKSKPGVGTTVIMKKKLSAQRED